jgi:asparagine synthase (glutamine-hydrolysing)
MSWIGGIFNKVNMDQGELRRELALMMETACPMSESSYAAQPWRISSILDDANGKALAQVSPSVGGIPPGQPHTACQEKLVLMYDGHLYNPEGKASKPSQVYHTVKERVAQPLVHLLAELPGGLEQKVRRALIGLDGDYALAVSDADRTVISRNSLGTKPLYFAENNKFSAFASNKKPLWKIGLSEVMPLRAGMLAIFDPEGVSVQEALPYDKGKIDIRNMSQAVNCYQETLCLAVRKRLAEVNHAAKVGVLLSGGVDSCLIAKLVHDVASNSGKEVTAYTIGLPDSGKEVIAYTVGLPDAPDVNFAHKFARELGIRHRMKILSINEIEECIPKVIDAIEDSDFVQVEAGIGIYAAMDMAKEDGIGVIFSGQGPDELWGGYNWYPRVLGKDGRQELCRRMWDDFTRADIETLDRENKIAMAHGVEMLLPFLDTEVVNVAMSVASELKVTSEEDHLGKHPHRQLAIKVGVPEEYANREKLAIQHGTNIHGVLDEIARKNGFDPDLVRDIGYKSEEITTAKMGSSSRYGYRYDEKKLWQVPQHVQLFLHTLAYRKGLLNKSVRDRVGYFLEKARFSS